MSESVGDHATEATISGGEQLAMEPDDHVRDPRDDAISAFDHLTLSIINQLQLSDFVVEDDNCVTAAVCCCEDIGLDRITTLLHVILETLLSHN